MHRKPVNPAQRKRQLVIVLGASLAVIISVCLTIIFTSTDGNGRVQDVSASSAQDVANQVGCGDFKHGGSGLISGLGIRIYAADSGTCDVDGQQYVVYTFPSTDIRNEWVQAANQIGENAKWQTDTAVVYPYR
jgi:hypothetical protein